MSTITGTINNGITLGQAGFTSPLKISHSGVVSNSTGVAVYAPGTYTNPSVANQGTIIDTGGFEAVELKDGGSVANDGKGALIQGYSGVDISGAAGAVSNSGTIVGTGTYGGGVVLYAGGVVANSGFIQGGPGVVAYFHFYGYTQTYKIHIGGGVFVGGSAGTVSNSGTLFGTNYGSGLFLSSGVFLASGGSVDNTGLIRSGVDIFGGGGGTVTNSGTIIGGVGISSFPFYGGPGTVTNSGTITGFVGLEEGGSLGNTGLIQGYGVDISGAAGMVTNSGTIVGTSTYLAGVNLEAGGSVNNTGLIQDAYGIRTRDSATVTNSGTIIGAGASDGAMDIEGSSLSSVSNTGLIKGPSAGFGAGGIYISYSGSGLGAVTNSGTIEGTGSPTPFEIQHDIAQRHNGGVLLGEGGSVGNTGLIQGVSGVYVGLAAGMVTNSGAITGTYLAGVILAAGGTVVDSGTITGSGTAISFGGNGGNLLALENGYKLGGSVSVAGTGNTLELLGAAGAVTVDFDKSGAGFSNFATVAFGATSNHTETLAITNAAVLPEKISGFTQLHDIVDLTQLAPKSANATLNASDQLVVGNGSQTVSLQLDPSENYSGVVWLARPDGSGGTDVAVIQQGDPAAQASFTSFGAAGPTGRQPAARQYRNTRAAPRCQDSSTRARRSSTSSWPMATVRRLGKVARHCRVAACRRGSLRSEARTARA
jgi:hypothetical protein